MFIFLYDSNSKQYNNTSSYVCFIGGGDDKSFTKKLRPNMNRYTDYVGMWIGLIMN